MEAISAAQIPMGQSPDSTCLTLGMSSNIPTLTQCLSSWSSFPNENFTHPGNSNFPTPIFTGLPQLSLFRQVPILGVPIGLLVFRHHCTFLLCMNHHLIVWSLHFVKAGAHACTVVFACRCLPPGRGGGGCSTHWGLTLFAEWVKATGSTEWDRVVQEAEGIRSAGSKANRLMLTVFPYAVCVRVNHKAACLPRTDSLPTTDFFPPNYTDLIITLFKSTA